VIKVRNERKKFWEGIETVLLLLKRDREEEIKDKKKTKTKQKSEISSLCYPHIGFLYPTQATNQEEQEEDQEGRERREGRERPLYLNIFSEIETNPAILIKRSMVIRRSSKEPVRLLVTPPTSVTCSPPMLF